MQARPVSVPGAQSNEPLAPDGIAQAGTRRTATEHKADVLMGNRVPAALNLPLAAVKPEGPSGPQDPVTGLETLRPSDQ